MDSHHFSPNPDHSRSASRMAQTTPPLSSTTLLQGNKTIGISHNGMLYTLQVTKLGKLILTK
jgi:hemin uptake protein HemP